MIAPHGLPGFVGGNSFYFYIEISILLISQNALSIEDDN
jgi:hypothetical protein